MSHSADDIVTRIISNAMETSGFNNGDKPGSALKRFHVSQTAEQLPDFRLRNAFYRAELERQIADKKEAERRRKEREAIEEDRFLRKIEADREKLRREYLDEIEKRRLLQEEAARKQQLYAKKLEEIHEQEERKREEEERLRQQAVIEKRIADLKEAVEKRKLEEAERRRLLFEQLYGTTGIRYPAMSLMEDESLPLTSRAAAVALARYSNNNNNNTNNDWDYFSKRPWNSREYVHSALHPDNLILEDVYFEAPLPILADVYKKLDSEKKKIKDIMRQRIIQDSPPAAAATSPPPRRTDPWS